MPYIQIENSEQLSEYLEPLSHLIRKYCESGDVIAQTAETIMALIVSFVDSDRLFLLCHLNDDDLDGFVAALAVVETVEVIALYGKNIFHEHKDFGFKMMKAWAREHGASRIVAFATRRPKVLYNKFYAPLGFKPIGLVLEASCLM